MPKSARHSLVWLSLSLGILLADQATKAWISHALHPGQTITVLSWLNLSLTHNTGAAFSFLGQADGRQRWLFIAISTTVSLFIGWWLSRSRQPIQMACALALTLGGATGNLCDRLFLGYVIDFIDFHIGHWHFATFNLADSAICLGTLLWLINNSRTTQT